MLLIQTIRIFENILCFLNQKWENLGNEKKAEKATRGRSCSVCEFEDDCNQ
jgi:hypothetical protein